jgi:polar amino acid transport system substrate-binding protein
VFVEKPLCLNHEELAAIVTTCRELQTADRMPVLQTGFNRRFSPAAGLLRRHFGQDHGPLVMVYRVNAGAIPRTHWVHDPVEGGGRIIGEVCHFIDLMQYIAGADPVSVQAQCIEAAGPDIIAEDHVLITLRFSDGSVGTVAYVAGGAKSLPKEYLEVHGDGRSAILDNFTSVTLSDDRNQRRKRCPGKGQREEVQAFLAALSEGRQPIPLVSQFATTLATFEAVASLRAGGEARSIDQTPGPEAR